MVAFLGMGWEDERDTVRCSGLEYWLLGSCASAGGSEQVIVIMVQGPPHTAKCVKWAK